MIDEQDVCPHGPMDEGNAPFLTICESCYAAALRAAAAEARREALEEAARLCDAKAAANVGGESMDEWPWPAKMWGALTLQAEKLATAIRALASSPSATRPEGEK